MQSIVARAPRRQLNDLMRLLVIAIVASLAAIAGCGRSEDRPTAEEAARLEALRRAAVTQLETMLGRPLTNEEKRCVVVELKDGKLDSRIVPPLSETVKAWHRSAQTKPS